MAAQEPIIPAPLCRICQTFPAKAGRRICGHCRYEQYLALGIRSPEKRRAEKDRRNELALQRYEENPAPRQQQSRAAHARKRPQRNQSSRAYYDSKRATILAQKKTARTQNPEVYKARVHTKYHRDVEASRAYGREYRWKHRERLRPLARQALAQRKLLDPQRVAFLGQASVARRKAKKYHLPCLWTSVYIDYALAWWGHTCAYCGTLVQEGLWHRLHWDHFIALSDPLCPGTVPWNMLPSCGSSRRSGTGRDVPLCNPSKGKLSPEVWLLRMTMRRQGGQLGRPLTVREQRKCQKLVTTKLARIALFFQQAQAYAVERGDHVLSPT